MYEYGDGLRLVIVTNPTWFWHWSVDRQAGSFYSTQLDLKLTSGATRRGLLVEGRKYVPRNRGKLHHRVQGAE